MKQFQEGLIELETEAEHLLLARHQVIFSNSLFFFFFLHSVMLLRKYGKIERQLTFEA